MERTIETTDYAKLFRLDGKVALVTGAARGIGAEAANALAQAGAQVVLTDLREELGEQTAAGLGARGLRAQFMRHDVADEAQWRQVVSAVIQRFGRIDVLVNVAGIELVKPIAETTVDDFRKIMDVNLLGTFLGLKQVLPAMSGQGGSIINIASTSGLFGYSFLATYATSKGGVRALTKSAALEFAQLKTGIRVNAIYPGFVHTPLGATLGEQFVNAGAIPDVATFDAGIAASHPLGAGEPRDIASAVLYLASDASRWVTGADFIIDGGSTA